MKQNTSDTLGHAPGAIIRLEMSLKKTRQEVAMVSKERGEYCRNV